MTVDEQKLEKWNKWLDAILEDVQWVLGEEEIYEEFEKVYNGNVDHIVKHSGGPFCGSIRLWYAFYAGFGIRRHCDTDSDRTNLSLHNFLNDLKRESGEFTFAKYMDFFPPKEEEDGEYFRRRDFKRFVDDDIEIMPYTAISRSKIVVDIKQLEEMRVLVGNYIDRLWAHLDKRGAAESEDGNSFSYGTIRDGVALVSDTTNKYLGLFNRGLAKMLPVKTFGWTGIFNVPLRAPTDVVSGDNGEDAT